MKDEISTMQKRPYQYYYMDGIWELNAGVFFFLLGLFYFLLTLIPSGTPLQVAVLIIGQPGIILLGIFGIRKVVRYMKERITYPRTGYVSYHRKAKKNRWSGMLTGLVLGIFFGFLASSLSSLIGTSWLPAVIGVLFAAVLYIMAYKTDVIRFYLLAVASIIIGTLVAFSGLTDWLQSAALFGGIGVCCILSGLAALFSYIHNTKPAEEGE